MVSDGSLESVNQAITETLTEIGEPAFNGVN